MNVIIETDIGHDPDDVFALLYLHGAGANIRAITIAEGDPYQVALVRLICEQVGLDIPIGVADLNRKNPKQYDGSFEGASVQSYVDYHHRLLKHYGHKLVASADGLGDDIIWETLRKYPDSQFFIIGAPKNTAKYVSRSMLMSDVQPHIRQVTFQGGFMGYDVHQHPVKRLDKFVGKTTCPSYNPNGDVNGTLRIIDTDLIDHLRFVSKNVCHTIVYNKEQLALSKQMLPKCPAAEMFLVAMDMYLERHNEKKFHDPCAAVCMLHPEIAQWVRGKMYREKGGWGTRPDTTSNSETIASIDEDAFWSYIHTMR